MTKVKICGITNLEDAMLSAKFGADALGFNFYSKSPRYILPEVAREIIEELPENVLNVGVFVNEDLYKIIEIAKTANLDAIQLHGEETPEFAKELKLKTGLEIIKAFRVKEDFNPIKTFDYEWDTILLDSYSKKEFGGTGETFDWWIANATNKIHDKVYLAGGINADNVSEALETVVPYGIDICSGVEKKKGLKDKNKLKAVFKQIIQFEIGNLDNIYKILAMLYKFHDSYLGSKSLTTLATYIDGFATAIRLTVPRFHMDAFEYPLIEGNQFSRWLAEMNEIPNQKIIWKEFILEKNDGNEEKAFDYFFEQLNKFIHESNINERFKLEQSINE